MSKITGSFIALVLVIVFSSIAYIWTSDSEKKALESQISYQQEQIDSLESQLQSQSSPINTISLGNVQGTSTSTGKVSGTILLSDSFQADVVVICANETQSNQETCTDFLFEDNSKSHNFELELPRGVYEVYVLTPPEELKVYYSDVAKCNEKGDCTSNEQNKRLIKVVENETESGITISL